MTRGPVYATRSPMTPAEQQRYHNAITQCCIAANAILENCNYGPAALMDVIGAIVVGLHGAYPEVPSERLRAMVIEAIDAAIAAQTQGPVS